MPRHNTQPAFTSRGLSDPKGYIEGHIITSQASICFALSLLLPPRGLSDPKGCIEGHNITSQASIRKPRLTTQPAFTSRGLSGSLWRSVTKATYRINSNLIEYIEPKPLDIPWPRLVLIQSLQKQRILQSSNLESTRLALLW